MQRCQVHANINWQRSERPKVDAVQARTTPYFNTVIIVGVGALQEFTQNKENGDQIW